jgi:hypothetical protein
MATVRPHALTHPAQPEHMAGQGRGAPRGVGEGVPTGYGRTGAGRGRGT